MASFLAALSFLTIFPARRPADVTQQAISNSRAWFPLVGLLLGLLLVGLEWVLSFVFPIYLTAAMLVVFLIVLTRALHLDGLMDTCDGWWWQYPGTPPGNHAGFPLGAFAVAGAIGVLLTQVRRYSFPAVPELVRQGMGAVALPSSPATPWSCS